MKVNDCIVDMHIHMYTCTGMQIIIYAIAAGTPQPSSLLSSYLSPPLLLRGGCEERNITIVQVAYNEIAPIGDCNLWTT